MTAQRRPRRRLARLPWLVATLALAPTSFAAEAGPNLVANPSMEEPDAKDPSKPAAWSTNTWGAVTPTFTWLQGDCAVGARCLRIDATVAAGKGYDDGDAKWWSAPFTVQPAATLAVSLQLRSDVPCRVMALAEGADGKGTPKSQWVLVKDVPAPSTGWAKVQASMSVPAFAATARLMVVMAATGRVEVDDLQAVTQASAAKHPAKVSLTFDDGWVSAYAYLVPELDARGLRATHFIISGYIDRVGYTADYVGSKRVRDLLGAGHEVASHTLMHQDMAKATAAELDENLELSRKALESFGTMVPGFAWPYGSYTATGAERARKTYSYVRTVEPGLNLLPYDLSKLKAYVVTNTTSVAEVESWVKQAEELDGAWLILVYHRADPEAPLDSYVTPQSFIDTLDMLQARNADIRPMGQWLDVWKAQPLPVVEPWVADGGASFDAPGSLPPVPGLGSGEGGTGCGAALRHGQGSDILGNAGLLALLGAMGLLLRRRRWAAQGAGVAAAPTPRGQ